MYSLNERCVHMWYLSFLAQLAILTEQTSPITVFFFHKNSQFTRQQGHGESISLILLYNSIRFTGSYYQRAITADSSPLHLEAGLKPLVSKRKSLITKLSAKLRYNYFKQPCVISSQEHLRGIWKIEISKAYGMKSIHTSLSGYLDLSFNISGCFIWYAWLNYWHIINFLIKY